MERALIWFALDVLPLLAQAEELTQDDSVRANFAQAHGRATALLRRMGRLPYLEEKV